MSDTPAVINPVVISGIDRASCDKDLDNIITSNMNMDSDILGIKEDKGGPLLQLFIKVFKSSIMFCKLFTCIAHDSIFLSCTVPYCNVLYSAVPCCTVMYCTVLLYNVLFCNVVHSRLSGYSKL